MKSRSYPSHHSVHHRADSSPDTSRAATSLTDSSSSSSSSTINRTVSAAQSTRSDGKSRFSVLCLHDFDSDDPHQLSFRKNEILDVFKQERTGWWAAMRGSGGDVGWIPQAFVSRLSQAMAKKLRDVQEDMRVYIHGAFDDEFFGIESHAHLYQLFGMSSQCLSACFRDVEWTPLSNQINSVDPKSRSVRQGNAIHPEFITNSTGFSPNTPPSLPSSFPSPPSASPPQTSSKSPPPPTDQLELYFCKSNTPIGRTVIPDVTPTSHRSSKLMELENTSKTLPVSEELGSIREDQYERQKYHRRSDRLRRVDSVPHTRTNTLVNNDLPGLELDNEGHVRFGTLSALVDRLTAGKATHDLKKFAEEEKYMMAFLMTFRTFTTAAQLFDMLVTRFRTSSTITCEDLQTVYYRCTHRRVLDVFDYWLDKHRLLDEEPDIAQHLTQFLGSITAEPLRIRAKQILNRLQQLTFAEPLRSSSLSIRKPRKTKAHKDELLRTEAIDIAEQLTILEHQLYCKVTSTECLAYAKSQQGPDVANLRNFCGTHEKLCCWVKSSVLNAGTITKRAEIIEFWIKVAEKCKLLCNFSSMSAVTIALSSTVISQLQSTWTVVSRKSSLELLLRYNDPTGGFSGYRDLLKNNIDAPCVPFISMFLVDLVHNKEKFRDEDERICFYQRLKWYETVSAILRYQSRSYDIPVNEPTMLFVQCSLKEVGPQEQQWFWTRGQELHEAEVPVTRIRKNIDAAGF